ncbi:FMN-dependent NADH-azoreductase [Amnibacterium kyonggiense]|uniref:FMN dependent NADH:quinone oxidoreductase n=1 Tax=Amnibacterium kyonggiense TaxID=595671 RepID=A0A4R7FT32_9MICO|nr:NAD(P)H-dependent oxidoreductase [Amnibacterium kyonggiense]TDS81037.1 FMN-dependent NADH-azoreductase [Amnibacterium kyonggiense]
MPRLLQLDSSIDPVRSRTRMVTAAFADAWRGRGDGFTVTARDLHADPVPHLTSAAAHWAPHLRREGEAPPEAEAALQRTLIDELVAADVLLIGAPMYNYSLPSTLKAWIDHVHVPGVTTPFGSETQPVAGRPAVIVTARGAVYDPGTATEGWDHAVPPLRLVLEEALGMDATVVTTDLTLADVVPALADRLPRAEAELAAAMARAAELGRTLGPAA